MKLDCPLAISLPPHCLVEMDNWRIVLKYLLDTSASVKRFLNFSCKPSKTGTLFLGESMRLQYMTEFSGLVKVEPELAPRGGTPEPAPLAKLALHGRTWHGDLWKRARTSMWILLPFA